MIKNKKLIEKIHFFYQRVLSPILVFTVPLTILAIATSHPDKFYNFVKHTAEHGSMLANEFSKIVSCIAHCIAERG